ncbi:SRPBCC family protein [Spirosoma fluminis]
MTIKKLVKTTGTILINKDTESVFNFFANPVNDTLWRTEINKSTLNGPLQVGVTVYEYSYLSKKAPDNLIELKCVQYDKSRLAIFETPGNAEFYLRSERQVNPIFDITTEIVYTLEFDINVVKFALGFPLPKFIISFKAGSDMEKYLQRLKSKLENQEQKPGH